MIRRSRPRDDLTGKLGLGRKGKGSDQLTAVSEAGGPHVCRASSHTGHCRISSAARRLPANLGTTPMNVLSWSLIRAASWLDRPVQAE